MRVLGSLASRVDPSLHPLLALRDIRPDSRTLVIIVTADKGLCGSFNTNIIKAGGAVIAESARPCTLGLVGRKGRDFFGRRGFDVLFDRSGFSRSSGTRTRRRLRRPRLRRLSRTGRTRRLVYNEFRSVMTQRWWSTNSCRLPAKRSMPPPWPPATDRLSVRAVGAGDLQSAPAAVRGNPGLPVAARIERVVFSRRR